MQDEVAPALAAKRPLRTGESIKRLEFGDDRSFQMALRQRADEYFRTTGRRPRDCWQMYVKTAVILVAFGVTYTLLVFVARDPWYALLLAAVLGLCTAGIGFNIQHDAGHKAYSQYLWVNKMMAMTMDAIGGSSYVWRLKHTVIHHTYVNIPGYDTDIDLGILGRMAPSQPRPAGNTFTSGRSTACWR